ncbi:MAG: hypothetical protein ACK5N8_00770 [Alphaproteobacteria bacterium]
MSQDQDLKWGENNLEDKPLDEKEKSGLDKLKEKDPQYAAFVQEQLPKTRTSIEYLRSILEKAKQKLEEAKRKKQEFENKRKEANNKAVKQQDGSKPQQAAPSNMQQATLASGKGKEEGVGAQAGQSSIQKPSIENVTRNQLAQKDEQEKPKFQPQEDNTPFFAPDENFANLLINEASAWMPKLEEQAQKFEQALAKGEETIHSAVNILGAAEVPDINLNDKTDERKKGPVQEKPEDEKDNSGGSAPKDNKPKGNDDKQKPEDERQSENENPEHEKAPNGSLLRTSEKEVESSRGEQTKTQTNVGTEKPKKKEMSDAAKIRNLSRGSSQGGRPKQNSGQSAQRPTYGRPAMKDSGR